MMSGKTIPLKNRQDGAIRQILLVSLSVFFLSVLAIAFHHHDNAFWLRACSICKAKSSLSGTISKYQVDSTSAAVAIQTGPDASLPDLSGLTRDFSSAFVSFAPAIPFPNKAPPIRS
jgi:hypothetical protein